MREREGEGRKRETSREGVREREREREWEMEEVLIKLRSEVCVERLIKLTEPGNVQYTDVVRRALEGKALVDPFPRYAQTDECTAPWPGHPVHCRPGPVSMGHWKAGKQCTCTHVHVHVVSTNKGLPLT